ncbi:MAG: HAD family hydrolase [Oscillospiraceae bacterium]|nr:HAD family hydrolase [Oscillospiraceae bacterium]
MKKLYVSDLDGTLLRSNASTSEYTNRVINSLAEKGILFSYATARSFVTAKKVTKGILSRIPLIVYNGTFVIDNVTEQVLISNYFGEEVHDVLEDLFNNSIYPIVYSFSDRKERFSYVPRLCSRGMTAFLQTRAGDVRSNPVENPSDLQKGNIFYITCIDESEKLQPLYEKYRDKYRCIYDQDLYTKEQWLEIMPLGASKANAAKQLQAMLGCDWLTVFGDGKNDIDMFEIADESYAVANAHADLRKIATDVILSNDEDGVAKWLQSRYEKSGL